MWSQDFLTCLRLTCLKKSRRLSGSNWKIETCENEMATYQKRWILSLFAETFAREFDTIFDLFSHLGSLELSWGLINEMEFDGFDAESLFSGGGGDLRSTLIHKFHFLPACIHAAWGNSMKILLMRKYKGVIKRCQKKCLECAEA